MSEPARPLAGLPADAWKPVDGFSNYAWSHRGHVRNVTTGTILKTRVSNRGYELVNVTNDAGEKKTVTMHTMVLRAHHRDPEPGEVARHLNDNSLDNRWPENLAWGTASENEHDKFRNGRPHPVPPPRQPAAPKACVRCAKPFKGNGKRCHACVVEVGEQAAVLLEEGLPLGEACRVLDYPSPEGLHTLAVRYGGYGQRRGLLDALITMRDRWLKRRCDRNPRRGDRA